MPQAKELLDLYEPIGTLKPGAEEIWIANGPLIMGYLGLYLPFTTRMTTVRLADHSLWVHSPIELTARLKAEVDSLGPVPSDCSEPNSLLVDRRMETGVSRGDSLRRAGSAGSRAWEWSRLRPGSCWNSGSSVGGPDRSAFRARLVSDRSVFFHRTSRSLILTDLIQNFEPAKVRSPIFRFLVRLSGCADPDGKAPIDLRTTFLLKRAEVRRAVEKMLEWKPERVIFAHGRWYATHGVEELRRAFRWTGVRK